MSAWRPIATAPKDDAWVLLHCPEAEGPVTMGTYFRDDKRDTTGRFRAGEWCLMEFDGLPSAGLAPTHWQPLPEPPDA